MMPFSNFLMELLLHALIATITVLDAHFASFQISLILEHLLVPNAQLA